MILNEDTEAIAEDNYSDGPTTSLMSNAILHVQVALGLSIKKVRGYVSSLKFVMLTGLVSGSPWARSA